ncbi:hypothetical protein [Mesorhizobium sp. M0968]|uniref:hypothetical protein n=1 Tax=Mesorhizobium sp. M0968 TaxID=2957037 RepID=UPI00333CF552
MVFRWRVEFGLAARKGPQLATVALIHRRKPNRRPSQSRAAAGRHDGSPTGRWARVFASAGSNADAVKLHLAATENASLIVVPAGVKLHLALGHTDCARGSMGSRRRGGKRVVSCGMASASKAPRRSSDIRWASRLAAVRAHAGCHISNVHPADRPEAVQPT